MNQSTSIQMIVDYGDYEMPLDDDKEDSEEENYEEDKFEEDNE